MSIATIISFVTALLGLAGAAFTFGLGAAPGWKELRWYSALALTGGLYGICDVATSLEAPDRWVVWGSMGSLFVGGLHCCSWLCYMASQRRRRLLRAERVFAVVILAFAMLALVPGALVSKEVVHHDVEWLGIRYHDALPTPLGGVCFVAYCASFVLPLLRYGRAWRAGETGAAAHVVGVGALFAAAVSDALAGAGLAEVPYLLSLAFIVLLGATSVGLVRRIVESVRQLDQLTRNLEQTVTERTSELARTQAELLQAEKLAAVGQLASGLAHEISNPAFAVVANLDYLLDHGEQGGEMPSDLRDCLRESRGSMNRIVDVVRKLLDATGATVDPRTAGEPTPLASSLAAAVRETRKVIPETVHILTDVPDDVLIGVPAAALEQILAGLLINAGQAIRSVREAGRIGVEARRSDGLVTVTVEDDGPGIPEAVQPRIFEPFFSTKEVGQGAGLGLAVARGLARSLGGDLRLERTAPGGTVMRVELPAAK